MFLSGGGGSPLSPHFSPQVLCLIFTAAIACFYRLSREVCILIHNNFIVIYGARDIYGLFVAVFCSGTNSCEGVTGGAALHDLVRQLMSTFQNYVRSLSEARTKSAVSRQARRKPRILPLPDTLITPYLHDVPLASVA